MNNLASISPETDGALIQVINLTKSYETEAGAIHVLRDINLRVYPGEIVAVMGPSGSGKSTLLFILGIFISPTRGSYTLGGQDVLSLDRTAQAEFRRNRVGFVFQSCDLLENSTVYENLEFPLIYAGVDRRERPDRIAAALNMVNLGNRIHHSSNRLSGGERQIILADEPTGQLDRSHGHQVMDHFVEIVTKSNTSVVVVTHDPEIAARCTRICSMRDGVLYEQ